MVALVETAGLEVIAWYGIRVLCDHATLDTDPPPPATHELAALIEAEELAGRSDP